MDIAPNNIKILAIDDEKVARIVLRRLLNKAGYENVVMMDSAIAALELVKVEKFHLIISDVKMPGMTGIEFLEELQKDEDLASIPVIMMSAIDELQLVYHCLQVGACDFLTKPIKQGMLQNLWQNVWHKRKERQLLELYQTAKGASTRTEEELRSKLNDLHQQVNEAVSTPLKAINDALSKLVSDGSLNDSVRITIGDILKTLQDSNVYKGAVETFIQEKSEQQLDPVTREWFAREFSITPKDRTRKSPSIPSGLKIGGGHVTNDSKMTEQLRKWEFDVWQIPDDETLFYMITVMFNHFGLLEIFRVDPKDFERFLVATRKLYSEKNPYHNFRHAFDVTHMVYLLLTNANAVAYLYSLEVFAILLCGLLHDVDHPGLNNTYQILTMSELAILYNDQSVLENHHCSTAFRLLQKYNILNHMSSEEKPKLRKLIVENVLATDLAKHMKMLGEFKTFLDGNPRIDRDNEEHRSIVSKMVLKAADLSNPAKPFRIAKYWADMIQEEFFMQGEREAVEGLPHSPFMERGNSSLPQMQVNFATFIVIPLYEALGRILPEVDRSILSVLLDNQEQWKSLLKAEKEQFQ